MNKTILLAGLSVALLAGCDREPASQVIPEVNDANCQLETIKQIKDNGARETFAGLCSRRPPAGGGIELTKKPMNWLELADPKVQKGQETQP